MIRPPTLLWSMLVASCALLRPNPPPHPAAELEPTVSTEPALQPEPEPEPEPDLVEVAVPREFRGLWIATVSNLDWPTRKGMPADEARAELIELIEGASQHGFNALVFQVRPEGDALYASELEPWSRFLTGRQGGDPGFDPLEVLVTEAHARNLEVHAWFNPYRAAANRKAPVAETHMSRWAQEHTRTYAHLLWMDPGVEAVQDHTLAVIDDVLTRYDIDGVHLDDYFYPYPNGKSTFSDQASFDAYRQGGGELGRSAWRRQNVDTLVEKISTLVADRCPGCKMGISPFGIYRPGQPAGIRGLDQVEALHADPLVWYEQGWVHYLAPQLYWSTQREAQRYDKLLTWWDDQVTPERPLLVGLDASKAGSSSEWSASEFRTQVQLSRDAGNTAGQIWFRAEFVLRNQAGVGDLIKELYAAPAVGVATPGRTAAPPELQLDADTVTITHPDPDAIRSLALYRQHGDTLSLEALHPPGTEQLTLQPGVWAISALLRGAVESEGVRFTVATPTEPSGAEAPTPADESSAPADPPSTPGAP